MAKFYFYPQNSECFIYKHIWKQFSKGMEKNEENSKKSTVPIYMYAYKVLKKNSSKEKPWRMNKDKFLKNSSADSLFHNLRSDVELWSDQFLNILFKIFWKLIENSSILNS